MLPFLIYEGKVAVALAVFFMFFRLFLKKETFHRFNRIVLVGMVVASFLLPFCIITQIKDGQLGSSFFVGGRRRIRTADPLLVRQML